MCSKSSMMMAQVCDASAQEALCERAVCSGELDMNEFLHAILPKDYVNLAVKNAPFVGGGC